MKRIFAIVITALLAFSCTKEGVHDGCPGELALVFAHDGNVLGFDSEIGNDVLLRIYEDDEFHSARVIPYSQISGGQKYRILKDFSGKVDIVAWSLPSAMTVTTAMEGLMAEGGRYPDAHFDISGCQTRADNPLTLSPLSYPLYLGKVNLQGEDLMTNTTETVSLKDRTCKVNVQVNDAEAFASRYSGKLGVGLEGTSCRISVNSYEACYDDERTPEIMADFVEESSRLTSGNMGVMPATLKAQGRADNEKNTLRVNVYNDGDQAFYIDTNEIAAAGKNITIIIRADQVNMDAQITVRINGYEVRTQTVQLGY